MRFCKVNQDQSITFPYSFNMLRRDNPQTSFPLNAMQDANLLASFNVFPVVENPPTFDAESEILSPNRVVFVDPDYVLQYTTSPAKSKLENGSRHPTSAELEVDQQTSIYYYMEQVQTLIDNVAASFNFGTVIRNRLGQLEFNGDINNTAKYVDRQGVNGIASRELITWNDNVWLTLRSIQADWLAGNIPAPTWAELLAQLPAAPTP